MKVTRITVGETWQQTLASSCLQKESQLRLVEFCVELESPIGINDLDSLIAAEFKIRSQIQRVLGTDAESFQAKQDIQSLQRKLEILQRLVEQKRKQLDAAEVKWKAASGFLKAHGINPDGWEIRFLSLPISQENLPSEQVPDSSDEGLF